MYCSFIVPLTNRPFCKGHVWGVTHIRAVKRYKGQSSYKQYTHLHRIHSTHMNPVACLPAQTHQIMPSHTRRTNLLDTLACAICNHTASCTNKYVNRCKRTLKQWQRCGIARTANTFPSVGFIETVGEAPRGWRSTSKTPVNVYSRYEQTMVKYRNAWERTKRRKWGNC